MTTQPSNPDRLDFFDYLALAVLNTAWSIIAWSVLFPMVSAPIALTLAAGLFLGWPYAVAVVGVSIAGMVLWRAKHPETFERWITARARNRFLTWSRYTRHWAQIVEACHLTTHTADTMAVPRLLGAEIGATVDRLRVRMLPGQCPADWEGRTVHLAHAFGAQECRASIIGPAIVELVFRHQDSLAHPVALPGIDDTPRGKEAA